MNVNLPASGVERAFEAGAVLVSNTGLKGTLTAANTGFAEIGGFSLEVPGKSHTIMCHLDKPTACCRSWWPWSPCR